MAHACSPHEGPGKTLTTGIPHTQFRPHPLVGWGHWGCRWRDEGNRFQLSLSPTGSAARTWIHQAGLWIAPEPPTRKNASGICFYCYPHHPVRLHTHYMTILVAAYGLVTLHADYMARAEVIRPLALVDHWTGWAKSPAKAVIRPADHRRSDLRIEWADDWGGKELVMEPAEMIRLLSVQYNLPVIKSPEAGQFLGQEEYP